MKKAILFAGIAFLAAVVGASADPPKTLGQIPVYPGAVLNTAQQRPGSVTYTVEAWPEEVFTWYVKQLGATKMDTSLNWRSDAETKTAAGASSSVVYDASALSKSDIADLTTTRAMKDNEDKIVGTWDGTWVKGILRAGRRRLRGFSGTRGCSGFASRCPVRRGWRLISTAPKCTSRGCKRFLFP